VLNTVLRFVVNRLVLEAQARCLVGSFFCFMFSACICLHAVFHIWLPCSFRGEFTITLSSAYKVIKRITFHARLIYNTQKQHKHSSSIELGCCATSPQTTAHDATKVHRPRG
jgi:hypothetical protein